VQEHDRLEGFAQALCKAQGSDAVSSDSLVAEVPTTTRRPLQFAYFCLILFMLVYYARPEDWIPGVNVIPLAKTTGALLILAFLLSLGQVRGRVPREVIYLVLLLQFFLAVPFSPVWKGGAFWNTLNFAKVVPVVFVLVWVLNTLSRWRRLIFLQTVCVTIIAVVAVWKGRSTHGRLVGVLYGNFDNPNDLACQIAIFLPFCLGFLLTTRNRIWKLAWAFAIVLMTYALLLTGSRGGFLALLVMFGACIWEFAIKGRYRFLLVFAVAGILCLGLFSGVVLKRFGAISNEKEDPAAFESAQTRRDVLLNALGTTVGHPLFGVGAGNFEILSGSWHSAHNTFLEMSADGGLPALILYLMILWRAFKNVRTVKRYKGEAFEHRLWAKALQASLLAFLVASCFASEAYQYFTYFLVANTSALLLITQKKQALERRSAIADRSAPDEGGYEQPSQSEPAWFPS
jgi:putative inorganic carbon (HCO3(-)) transporter